METVVSGVDKLSAVAVAGALRLVHRVHLKSGNGSQCASAICEELRRVFNADLVVLGEIATKQRRSGAFWMSIATCGPLDENVNAALLTLVNDEACPVIAACQADPDAIATRRRIDVSTDEVWTQSLAYRNVLAPAGLGETIVSRAHLPHRQGWSGCVIMARPLGRGFTDSESWLLDTLVRELSPWIWTRIGVGAVTMEDESRRMVTNDLLVERLSPAQRVVLPFLLDGLTEVEIAKRIYRSRYTVHDHARAIYGALRVRNRVELVRLFMSGDVPPLSVHASTSKIAAD